MSLLLPKKKQRHHKAGLVGVNIDVDSISMAYIEQIENSKSLLVDYEYVYSQETELKAQILKKFVQKNNLEGTECSYILAPSQYSINFVDSISMTTEQQTHVNQIATDFLDLSVSTIDSFSSPLPRAKDNSMLTYIVSIPNINVQQIEETIQNSNLTLQYIDIATMATRNIVSLLPEEQDGTLVIYVQPDMTQLTLCKNKEVYTCRNIKLELKDKFFAAENDADFSATTLEPILNDLSWEIRRTIDYCLDIYQANLFKSISILPKSKKTQIIAEHINNHLGTMPVKVISLVDLLQTNASLDKEAYCTLAVGGALRSREIK